MSDEYPIAEDDVGEGSEDAPRMAGNLVLFVATIAFFATIVQVRFGGVPSAAWGIVAAMWGAGTLIKIIEIEGGVL